MDSTTRHCDECGRQPAWRFRFDWESDEYDHSTYEVTADLCGDCMAALLETFTARCQTDGGMTGWVKTHQKYMNKEGGKRRAAQRNGR